MTPAVVLGLALLAIYWAWIAVFFGRVRPWLMAVIGSRLGVRVRESTNVIDAGTWDVSGKRATLPKTGAVLAADLAILFVGTVGVAAFIFVPAFIVAESGALLPIEASLTGRGAALRVFDAAEMGTSEGRARLPLDLRNTGREPLRDCYGMVEGYSARDGYLHGRTERFELAVGERRPVWIELEAMRPPVGTRGFRLKLECGNERLAVADAVLRVR
jgi:hypothetical protein